MADTYKCILEHTQAGSEIRKLLEDELENFKRLKEAGLLGDTMQDKFLNDKIKQLLDREKKDILLNDEAFKRQTDAIRNNIEEAKKRGKNLSGAQSLLDLIQTNYKWGVGNRNNLSKKITAEQNKWIGNLFIELNNIQHHRENININLATPEGKRLNDNIAKERARLNGAQQDKTNDKIALEYATALNNTRNKLIKVANAYGIEVNARQGYAGPQTHNKKLLKQSGFNEWFDFLQKEGNIQEAPFLTDREVLKKIYDNLTNSTSISSLDILISMKKSLDDFKVTRAFPFKDIDAELRYQEKFGYGANQIQGEMQSISRLASDIQVRSTFGSSPEAVIKRLYNEFTREGNSDNVRLSKILTLFNEVQGKYQIENESLAIAGRNIRSVIGTGIYGAVAYTTPISDRMLMAFKSWQRNGGLGELFTNLSGSIFTGLKDTGEYIARGIDSNRKGGFTVAEKQFALENGIAVQSMISAIGKHFEDVNNLGVGQGVSKVIDGINKAFSKFSLLEIKQNVDDAKDFVLYARELYKDFQVGNWNNLSEKRKAFLNTSGITPTEFNILKQINVEVNPVYNERIFTANMVNDLTNTQLQPLIEQRIQNNRSLQANDNLYNTIRYDLENKIRTLFTSESYGQRGYKDERANILTRGTKAGTISGELTRFITQGKSFPFVFWDNIITSIYDQVSATRNEKFAAFAAFAGASILGGYVVEQINELRNLKEPQQFSKEIAVRSLVRSGIFGIYGDLANASFSQAFDISKTTGYQTKANLYKELLGLFGPTISKTGDILEGVNNLMAKRPDPDKLIKSIKSNIPGLNIFYVSGMINYLTLELSQALGGKGLQKNEKLMREQKNIFGERRKYLFED